MTGVEIKQSIQQIFPFEVLFSVSKHMEFEAEMKKSSSIFKKLESYLSINRHNKSSTSTRPTSMSRSRSCAMGDKNRRHVNTPNGCFPVYVGPEKQRFVIKTKYLNHPLFKMLLEDAEMEYGFTGDGPLLFPCEVDLFCQMLAEMKYGTGDYTYSSCSPFVNPAQRLGTSDMAKGYCSYGLLTPQRSFP